MIQLSWNCQRLGNPLTVLYLKDLIRSKNPTVIFLMETKRKNQRLELIQKECGFSNGFSVEPLGLAGRLAVWWNLDVTIEILGYYQNWIDSQV